MCGARSVLGTGQVVCLAGRELGVLERSVNDAGTVCGVHVSTFLEARKSFQLNWFESPAPLFELKLFD